MIITDVLILGCGWTGITTAYYMTKKGIDNVICVDADLTLGGLMKTVNVNGFIFDIGGSHIIFSSNEHTLKDMLSFLNSNVVEHHRKAFIYLSNFLVPYPFENGLYV